MRSNAMIALLAHLARARFFHAAKQGLAVMLAGTALAACSAPNPSSPLALSCQLMVKTVSADWTAALLSKHLSTNVRLEVDSVAQFAPQWWSVRVHDAAQPSCEDLAARIARDPLISAAEVDRMVRPNDTSSKKREGS